LLFKQTLTEIKNLGVLLVNKIFFFILSLSLFAQADVSTSRRYSDVTLFLKNLKDKYPQNVESFILGYSNDGAAIEGLKLGNGSLHNLVVATHHGNEYGSTELALAFAESLAVKPIEDQTIYLIPVLNINGFDRRSREERVNGNYLDLNRDYPGPCGSEGPFYSRSTKALADLIEKENIITSATLHTNWPAVLYPWGVSTHDTETEYDPTFKDIVKAAVEWSNYSVGNSTVLLYPADGAFEDYAFWKHGIWSILFEVGRTHNPNTAALNEIVKGNVPGLRKMFDMAPKIRAESHEFKGRCENNMKLLDLHIE
jgi:carboxypeptidase T